MSYFLRKLSEETCTYNNNNIYQNGTYAIGGQQDTVINATGIVFLNYTSPGEYVSQISPQNTSQPQAIYVYGFTSEIVSNYGDCTSTTSEDVMPQDVTEDIINLIIDLVKFGIEAFKYIDFIPRAPAPHGVQDPVTIIQLDVDQTLTLYNVSQDSLTEANFIFAPSSDSNDGNSNNNDDSKLAVELGVGLGGGLTILMSLVFGYMYHNKVCCFKPVGEVDIPFTEQN